jgi:hypothetical protein
MLLVNKSPSAAKWELPFVFLKRIHLGQANRAKLYIGLVKEAVRKDMKESDCPIALWDYCAEHRVRIHNLTTAKNSLQLDGQTPSFFNHWYEGDISNLCQFKWYEWVYYREGSTNFPLPREVLGCSLGPVKGEGNEMAQWCLKANGNVVPHRSVRQDDNSSEQR